MKNRLASFVFLTCLVCSLLLGCKSEADKGTLEFYANGEDFVRQGFVSKDGWNISFEHVYVNLAGITAYQTDPPYDPHSGSEVKAEKTVSLDGVHTIDLAEGGEDVPPILVGAVDDAAPGHYNAISWKMSRASSGPAPGQRAGHHRQRRKRRRHGQLYPQD